jgi:membrane associated rhomboid family serine protease
MLPIGDDNTGHRLTPFINYLLIAINALVFIFLQGAGSNEQFTYAFSTVPAEIINNEDLASGYLEPTPIPVYGTLITSMFMHGGWAHLLGNMLYLWIFGDNLENRMGHGRYLAFYLICGLIASLAHVFTTNMMAPEHMMIPSLGASGAISGVLGGYMLILPRQRVRMLLGRGIVEVPAFVALGIWILFQVIQGMGMLGGEQQGGGGVAYAAHIGGFIAGLILVKFFVQKEAVSTTRNRFNT